MILWKIKVGLVKLMYNLEIGIGKIDISPPEGIELSGYGIYRGRRNIGIHDKLYCRALFLKFGEEEILLINNDLIGINSQTLKETREKIGNAIGLNHDRIIISCTHTHSGPATVPLIGWGEIEETYLQMLPKRFLEAATIAKQDPRKVKVKFGRSVIKEVGHNRVLPGGSIDTEVRILEFVKEDPKKVATLFNYSCHAVAIDVRTEDGFYVSADWPGYVMRILAKKGAGETFFLQGMCGDIDPKVAWHMRGFDAAREVGKLVANAVLKASGNSTYVEVDTVKVKRKEIKLPFQKINEKYIVNVLLSFLDQIEKKEIGTIEDIRAHVRFYRTYAEDMIAKLEEGMPDSIETEIQVLRLGDIALIFLPGEIFVDLGLEIMSRSPFKKMMVVGYSANYVGYIPTSIDFEIGGYASTKVPIILRQPPYLKSVGKNLVEESINLLNELTS
ncbi:TPA: hypothetical protein EYP70_00190 [Candidatus Bathyarchaeota archaeon]|nr:hypothetical protein [Candidatus Bathyarchaeota archaeon]